MSHTHATEWGLARLAGVSPERSGHQRRACSGVLHGYPDRMWIDPDAIPAIYLIENIPTCPQCAVLRDAALEGRLPSAAAAPPA